MGEKQKILVAYYSYSGNTAAIAKVIAGETGADLLAVEPAAEYPADYCTVMSLAKKETAEGYRPPLKPGADISGYEVIFVGSPNWCGTIAPPMASFLEGNDLSGRTVVPFWTHGGGGDDDIFRDIRKFCPRAKVAEGKGFRGCCAETGAILEWLRRLDLK